jgi:hypothetical protein
MPVAPGGAENRFREGSSAMPSPRTYLRYNLSSQARRLLAVSALGLLLLITLRPGVAQASVSFEVKGQWTCDNRGTVTPLAGARLELWLPGGLDPVVRRKARRDAHQRNGTYSFSVKADDSFDPYSKVVMNDDQGLHLGNWYSFSDHDTETETVGSHARQQHTSGGRVPSPRLGWWPWRSSST